MAYGSELYLGVMGVQNVTDTLRQLGIEWKLEGDPILNDDPKFVQINDALKKAHRAALEEIGMEIIDASKLKKSNGSPVKDDPDYLYVMGTDDVVRQTVPWRLEVDYDPREMGHEPDDVLLGVSLISRYFPVYLDWNKNSGGSGDTISLTPDVLEKIEIARKHISPIVPFIENAPIVFRERHY